jgi:hypothetical protein
MRMQERKRKRERLTEEAGEAEVLK